MVEVFGLVEINLADHQNYQSNNRICYLLLKSIPNEFHFQIHCLFIPILCLNAIWNLWRLLDNYILFVNHFHSCSHLSNFIFSKIF